MKINSLSRRLTDQPIFVDRNGNELLSYNRIKVVSSLGSLISEGTLTIENNSLRIFYSVPNLKINTKIKLNDIWKLKDFAITKSSDNIFYCFGFIKI